VQTSGNTIPSAALNLCSLCSGRLCFFPLTATTIVSSVVSSAATALQLLIWSDTLSGWVSIPASHTPRCIAAVTLRVSEALAAFALQRPFKIVVSLYFYSQTAELGERSHFCDIGAPCHGHNEAGVRGPFFSRSWSRRRDRSCMTACTWMRSASSSSLISASGMRLPKFFNNMRTHRSYGSEKV
jgi:hypothetical protein